MDGFRIAYLFFGTFICVSGAVMIVTYSMTFPWWRQSLGRMLVVYATAEILMSGMLTITVVAQTGPHWFRGVWFVLQVVVGGCFCYQTGTILRLRRARTDADQDLEDAL